MCHIYSELQASTYITPLVYSKLNLLFGRDSGSPSSRRSFNNTTSSGWTPRLSAGPAVVGVAGLLLSTPLYTSSRLLIISFSVIVLPSACASSGMSPGISYISSPPASLAAPGDARPPETESLCVDDHVLPPYPIVVGLARLDSGRSGGLGSSWTVDPSNSALGKTVVPFSPMPIVVREIESLEGDDSSPVSLPAECDFFFLSRRTSHVARPIKAATPTTLPATIPPIAPPPKPADFLPSFDVVEVLTPEEAPEYPLFSDDGAGVIVMISVALPMFCGHTHCETLNFARS